jgi:hypothetical protein
MEMDIYIGSRLDLRHQIPDIITFVTGENWLNRPNLYPRQGTLLKIIFLDLENMTKYDYDVIEEWENSYLETADETGEGNNGIVPGILDRIKINRLCPCGHDKGQHTEDRAGCADCLCHRYEGRYWFHTIVSAIGRRGAKGHIGALATAYVLWHYIQVGDPQGHYGVDRDKRMEAFIFAGKKEQAKANQWGDIYNILIGAPCFTPFISRPLGESLTIRSKRDFLVRDEREKRGIFTDQDTATFRILPKESTTLAARGPATFCLIFDEAAHVVKAVAKAEAQEVYNSAEPSLDQFGKDGFIYIPSSTWQKIGLFYGKYQEVLEVDEEGNPVYPEKMLIQLTSWDIYKDWEIAHTIRMWPGGLFYLRLRNAIQTYDHHMQQLERSNPETFRVERMSHFAAVLDAYLHEDRIAAIWAPWPDDQPLVMQEKGKLSVAYRAHGDPSISGANFGFGIAHVEQSPEDEFPHVVFDLLHAWLPQDYEGHEVDYLAIQDELEGYLDAFMPSALTFDQFSSVGIIQRLRRYAHQRGYPKTVQVYERSATGPLNWQTYETFKTALGLGLVHAPFFELANMELTFLQVMNGNKVDHPTAGPVQTKDVADVMAILTYELIGDDISSFVGQTLGDLRMRAATRGGIDPYRDQRDEAFDALSRMGRRGTGLGVRRQKGFGGQTIKPRSPLDPSRSRDPRDPRGR